ncbi:hypothetical protein BDN72DRAFT_847268 [Pluteus cervinus]|uniref:Uncharacterized protein n=1 Tax=Pluteus cervinus TaxID=181527 RepID=A0ACD3ADX2_9AGAR|nr:hypothetical protein BDN72DRAFT_847268 [Pluteus cervinus]
MNDSHDPYPLKAPLQLASVCYRWWKIALSTPALWSYIIVDPDHATSSLRTAALWIDRSRFASFRLHLKQGVPRDEPPLSEFLESLRSSPIRFKRLEIEIDNEDESGLIMDLLFKDHSDELEDLKIRHNHVLKHSLPPSLQRLFLLYSPDSLRRSPPPENLTILRVVMEIHWDMLEWCLFHCKRLKKVLVSLCETGTRLADGLPVDGTRRLIRNDLIYLGITNDCQDVELPEHLLRNFTFPSLRLFDYYADKEVTASISWLLSLSFIGQIRRLVLQLEFDLKMDMILSILRNAYALEELSVYNMPEFHFLETLSGIPSTSDSFLLPRLKHLHVGSLHNMVLPFSDIEPIVKAWSRSAVGSGSAEGTGDEPPIHDLSYIHLHHWHQDKGEYDTADENQTRLDLKTSLQDTYKSIDIRMVRHVLHEWVYNVPILFEMFPLSFNEERKFEVMQRDGSWKMEIGGMYIID